MNRDEYVDRFGLTTADRSRHILEYGHGLDSSKVFIDGFSQPVTQCAPRPDGVLPFADFTFDLALCPDYLFSDEDHQDVDFHLQQIFELARVAKEVRIFPLSNHERLPSPLLGPVLLGLQQENYGIEVRDVNSLSQPKGDAMLRVWAQLCHVS